MAPRVSPHGKHKFHCRVKFFTKEEHLRHPWPPVRNQLFIVPGPTPNIHCRVKFFTKEEHLWHPWPPIRNQLFTVPGPTCTPNTNFVKIHPYLFLSTPTDRQTNQQTNRGRNTTALAEATIPAGSVWVVKSVDHGPLPSVELALTRTW